MEQIAKRINKFEELDESQICYWKGWGEGDCYRDYWMIYFPKCGIGNLSRHTIVEHGGGTITVTPSILTIGHDNGKPITIHGYLTKGVWRAV